MTLYWLFYSGLRRHYIITIRDEWRHAWTCILGGGKKLLAKLSSLILMERAWYPDRILHLSRARLKINWPRGKKEKKKKTRNKWCPRSKNCIPFMQFKMHDEAKEAEPAPVWSQGRSLSQSCLSWCNSWRPYKALGPNKKWQTCPCFCAYTSNIWQLFAAQMWPQH